VNFDICCVTCSKAEGAAYTLADGLKPKAYAAMRWAVKHWTQLTLQQTI